MSSVVLWASLNHAVLPLNHAIFWFKSKYCWRHETKILNFTRGWTGVQLICITWILVICVSKFCDFSILSRYLTWCYAQIILLYFTCKGFSITKFCSILEVDLLWTIQNIEYSVGMMWFIRMLYISLVVYLILKLLVIKRDVNHWVRGISDPSTFSIEIRWSECLIFFWWMVCVYCIAYSVLANMNPVFN